jgi:rhomboid protease GluP
MDSNWPNSQRASQPTGAQPEILPPLQGDGGLDPGRSPGPSSGQAQGGRERKGWAAAPATYLLLGVNIAAFLSMAFLFSTTSPSSEQLLAFGADNGGRVLMNGEWWRLATATFVHAGPLHIATNMWCLWNLGLLGEPLLGSFGTIAVYLLTGVAGNLLSIALNPGAFGDNDGMVGVGASGAVFGIAGVLILLLKSKRLPAPEFELKRLRRSVIYFAALNFVIGASTLFLPSPVRIDNMAHLGGFLSGLALGVPLLPRIGSARPEFVRRQRLGFGGLAFFLALFAYGLFSFHHPQS